VGAVDREEWDRRYQTSELVWTAQPNRFVVAELTDLAPGRALDLATGEGRNAVWLAEWGWRVTAVDFSDAGLAKARRLAGDRGVAVDWVNADVRTYVPDSGGYDLVLVAYLHLQPAELAAVLHHCVDALALDGTLLVIGHDLTNLTEGVGGPKDSTVLYTPESVVAELDGMRIRRAQRVRRPVETDDGVREAVDALVRAVRA
jgi:SAM-dependent methyltransferase